MKRTVIKVLITCLIVSGVGVGGYFVYQKIFGSKTVAANVSYATMVAKKMNLQVNVQGTGSVYAANTKDLVVSNNGTISGLTVNVGDAVNKDTLLCTLSSEQADKAIESAQANLEKQKLSVASSTIDKEIELQKMVVNDAQNDLNTLLTQQSKMTLRSPIEGTVKAIAVQNGEEINTGKAVVTIEGKDSICRDVIAANSGVIKDLKLTVGAVVKKDATICMVYSDQINKQVSSAKTNLEKQKLQLTKLINESDTNVINQQVVEAQKELNSAITAKDSLTLKAPFDGIITAKNNSNGENAQAGKTILTVADTSSYKIKLTVDELDIAKIKLGQKAEIKFDGLKDQVFQGAVEQISKLGNASNNVTTFDVVVSIENAENVYLGMNANINILVESKENALVIPVEALVEQNGKKYVMVANSQTGGETAAPVSAGQGNEQNDIKPKEESTNNGQAPQGNNENGQGTNNRQGRTNNGNFQGATSKSGMSSGGRLIEIKTGLENEDYIEVLEGITDGQRLLVQLPQSTTQSNTKQIINGGFGGSGNFGGNGNMGGSRPQMQPSGGKGN